MRIAADVRIAFEVVRTEKPIAGRRGRMGCQRDIIANPVATKNEMIRETIFNKMAFDICVSKSTITE